MPEPISVPECRIVSLVEIISIVFSGQPSFKIRRILERDWPARGTAAAEIVPIVPIYIIPVLLYKGCYVVADKNLGFVGGCSGRHGVSC